MRGTLRLISTTVIALMPVVASAQIARVEVHPVQSVTMSDQDFLNGRKDGRPVTLAGQLRIPRPSYADPCVELGPTIAYDEKAHAESVKAVKEFVAATLKL